MADEINIYIKNQVDVTSTTSNPSPTATTPSAPTPKKTNDVTNSEKARLLGMGVKDWINTGNKLASSLGIDTSSISKLTHYGYSVIKAVTGDPKDKIQLAMDIVCDLISEVKTLEASKATQQNAVDEARINAGLLNVSGATIKLNRWNGRITYGKYGR